MKLLTPRLPYAETHFKFKLPWSPLFKRAPEMFFDCPHQVVPGQKLAIWFVVKDAHRFPVTVSAIDYSVSNGRVTVLQGSLDWAKKFDQGLHFEKLPIPMDLEPGSYEISFYVYVKNYRGKALHFANWNLPGLPARPLKVRILQKALPYPENWLAGEHHCHTSYTSDPVEFGAPVPVMMEAAQMCGLNYVVFTDHSYNFNYDSIDYMKPVVPEDKWAKFVSECSAWNLENSGCMAIPGEEISCGNSRGENIHFIGAGLKQFIQGHGDSGRRWFKNHPDYRIPEVLEQAPEAVFYAAHPQVEIGRLERLIFRRGKWNPRDFDPRIHGWQFWNGSRNAFFEQGKQFWIDRLGEGHPLLPIAGNDAHGDLNCSFGVQTPLFKLKVSENHIFGKVRTLFPVNGNAIGNLMESMKGNENCCTEGPFISLSKVDQGVEIRGFSQEDFGLINEVKIYGGGPSGEHLIAQWSPQTMQFSEFKPTKNHSYVRAETLTAKGLFALTSALFLK